MKIAQYITSFVVIFFVNQFCSAQSWRELQLPPESFYIRFTGNTTQPGALAIWTQGKSISDSSLTLFLTPARFYTSTNGGSTWNLIDSSSFTMIDKPPQYYADSPLDISYVGNVVVRTTLIFEGFDVTRSFYEYRKGNNPFRKGTFSHQVSIDEGTPWIYLTDGNVMYNVFLRLDEPDDSTTFALLQSSNGGTSWNFVPDSMNGIKILPRATALTFRPRFPEVMLLGTVQGLLRSADVGASWQPLPTNTALDEMWIRLIHIHPNDPNLVFASGYKLIGEDRRDYLFRSSDGGWHWDQSFVDTVIYQIATSEADRRIVMMNTSSGLYLSTNQGVVWTPVQRNLPAPSYNSQIRQIHIDPGNASRAYAAYATKIFVNDNLLSIDQHEIETPSLPALFCFPNPVIKSKDSYIEIKYSLPFGSSSAEIHLMDLFGRTLYGQIVKDNRDLTHGSALIHRSVFSKLTAGVYIIFVQAGNAHTVQKIIIQD